MSALVIGAMALLVAQAQAPDTSVRAIRGHVRDAISAAPVSVAELRWRSARVLTDAEGRFTVVAAIGDTIHIRRIGYRAAAVVVSGDTLAVALVPATVTLASVVVRGERDARLTVARSVDEARALGATTAAGAVAQLPFVAARSARGEQTLSLRGARAEQVVVALDGLALNDPATGVADISDLPLAALGAMAVRPGSDALRYGSGAAGGVVELHSADAPVLALSAGSWGRAAIEGATSVAAGGGRVRLGAAWRGATNDFEHVRPADALGERDSTARRANSDERVASLFAAGVFPRAQWLLLASDGARGLVGRENVDVYDDARGRTRRALARAAARAAGLELALGARLFTTRYDDPRSRTRFDARSRSFDADAARTLGPVAVRVGGGLDAADATAIAAQRRARASGAAQWSRASGAWRTDLAARVDAVERTGVRLSPSAHVERTTRTGAIWLRGAQAFRAPTLSDLFFASARTVNVVFLAPERVTLDAELGTRTRIGAVALTAAVFERRTADAIVWFPGNFGWTPTNVANERVRGAEVRGTVAGRRGELALWGAAYDTRLVDGAAVFPTPYVARATGGALALVRHGPLSLAAQLTAQSRRPFANAPADREFELAGTALIGAQVGWRGTLMKHSALATAGVDNAGDHRWESVRGFPSPGRSWTAALTFTP